MNKLVDNGYIFLKSVYSKDELEKIKQDFLHFFTENKIHEDLNKKEDVIKNNYYVNNTYTLLNSYHKMQFYYLPVFDNRAGHNRLTDKGMIDIFNVHKILPSINEIINLEVILNILNKLTQKEWVFERINLHICNNVVQCNDYHYDNNNCIKFSIYLNDVIDGGLSFIEKSHINKNISNKDIKNFHGNTGDVLISYQNGFHKKLPQKNSINYFLILNFNLKN